VLAHERLGRGMPALLDHQTARQLALAGYRDPVSDEPGTWLAFNALLARHIAWWSLPFALGVGLTWHR
jgi:hypothetical protein